MKPTDVLKEEHDAILLALKVIAAMAKRIDAGGEVPVEHMNSLVDFIRNFADYCHHGKEEDLLFKEMEKAGFPANAGPIGVMLAEHEEGREYVREMAKAAAAGSPKDFAHAAVAYANLLAQHIDKENNILYEMADQSLTPEQQRALEEGFERVEEERMGPEKHVEYRQLVENLARHYDVEK